MGIRGGNDGSGIPPVFRYSPSACRDNCLCSMTTFKSFSNSSEQINWKPISLRLCVLLEALVNRKIFFAYTEVTFHAFLYLILSFYKVIFFFCLSVMISRLLVLEATTNNEYLESM